MGYAAAAGYAGMVAEGAASLRQAVAAHMSSNLVPSPPRYMIDPAVQAIEAFSENDPDRLINLPDEVTFQGETQAPAGVIIDNYRLEAFTETL